MAERFMLAGLGAATMKRVRAAVLSELGQKGTAARNCEAAARRTKPHRTARRAGAMANANKSAMSDVVPYPLGSNGPTSGHVAYLPRYLRASTSKLKAAEGCRRLG